MNKRLENLTLDTLRVSQLVLQAEQNSTQSSKDSDLTQRRKDTKSTEQQTGEIFFSSNLDKVWDQFD